MIPSLLEQVVAAKVPSAVALAIMDKMDDNLNRLAEWMTGRNVTVASAAQALEVSEPTMRAWLKRLVFRRLLKLEGGLNDPHRSHHHPAPVQRRNNQRLKAAG